ncbi:MAG TPA: SRPBCC family protein [Pseudonocardia sp.]|nr:SRPBCC family protein [Pseudonocardia sp.]
MSDIVDQIQRTHRELTSGRIPAGDGRTVTLRRTYRADLEDVWQACTDPERLARWFLPVTVAAKVGGQYQLEGQAGGEILRCEPPRLLAVTWVFGENPTDLDVTEVELRLTATGPDETELELRHTAVVAPDRWTEFGPGAVGVGWDIALLSLAGYLAGEPRMDEAAWTASAEGIAYIIGSGRAFGRAQLAAEGDAAAAELAARNTIAFYTGTEPA